MAKVAPPAQVRYRFIEDADIPAIVDLLTKGFPKRSKRYWSDGFKRLAARPLPGDAPRYGLMLDHGGTPVGVILLLYTQRLIDGKIQLRCNLSSWYVDPDFRMQASLLILKAIKARTVTFFNISPAPYTWPTIEAQGFRRYTEGLFVGAPALRPRVAGARIHRIHDARMASRFGSLPEWDLLVDHASMGCISLVVESREGSQPFVFMPFTIRSGQVRPPVGQLIYCRDVADYRRFAGPLGRYLLWRGALLVVHDADGPERGLLGRFFESVGPKFFRGPDRPKHGDLAYTERVFFGP